MGDPHAHACSPKSDFARLSAILSSIRKAKSREKARRDESEDEGNEMILGSWTFILLSGKNRAREEIREQDKRAEERMDEGSENESGCLPLAFFWFIFFLISSPTGKKGKSGEMRRVCK